MASVNKEVLKKHHFWILTGLAPLLVLIAVILITSGVGSAIDKKKDEIDSTTKTLGTKQSPKSNHLITLMDGQKTALEAKRGDLWKENWERQIGVDPATGKQDPEKNLLRWPVRRSDKLAPFNYTADYLKDPNQLRFGELVQRFQVNAKGEPVKDEPQTILTRNEFKRREVYLAEYSNAEPLKNYAGTGMADTVAPTRFANGWQTTLRYVTIPETGGETGWGVGPVNSDQLWLALEDVWVQRALLQAIRQVNADVGRFDKIDRRDENGKALPDNPLERRFKSRLWEVELKVTRRDDNKWFVGGKLRNLSDRLQLLGSQVDGRPAPLRLMLKLTPDGAPWPFEIEGAFVAGGATIDVQPTERHVLPPTTTPIEIFSVEQPFDGATVPVRRIDRMVLGYKDSRHAGLPLKGPDQVSPDDKDKVFPEYKRQAAAAADGGAAGSGGMEGYGGAQQQQMSMKPGGAGAAGGTRGGGSTREGGGAVGTVVDGNKARYVDVTPQVRRMPVAISLITDQAYIQDVLLAYANSPLRFQVTQVHWQRFRGNLGGPAGGGGSAGGTGPFSGMPAAPGVGGGGGGGGGMDEGDRIGGSASGQQGSGFDLGGGGLGGKLGGFGPAGGGPSLGGGSGNVLGGGAGGGSISEAQLSSGLVELTIYGVVSIYDKYVPPADAATAAAPKP